MVDASRPDASLPALPVECQQVMSPSAQEVAAAMIGTGTNMYGATGSGLVTGSSVANGMVAAPGLFANIDPNRTSTHTVAQRANDLMAQATGDVGTIPPDMVMPRRHPDLADAERPMNLGLLPQAREEALQPVSNVAAPLQQPHAAAAQDAPTAHLQGIQRMTTGHVANW